MSVLSQSVQKEVEKAIVEQGLLDADEFDWSPVEQSKEYSLTGALVIQQGMKAAGRPITLQSNGGAWVSRSTLEAVQEFCNTPDKSFELTIDADTYWFQFERPGGVKATEVQRLARGIQGAGHWYTIEIKGFEVAAP